MILANKNFQLNLKETPFKCINEDFYDVSFYIDVLMKIYGYAIWEFNELRIATFYRPKIKHTKP